MNNKYLLPSMEVYYRNLYELCRNIGRERAFPYVCVDGSVFLSAWIKNIGYQCNIMYGYREDIPYEGITPHCWVETQKDILDSTAMQFYIKAGSCYSFEIFQRVNFDFNRVNIVYSREAKEYSKEKIVAFRPHGIADVIDEICKEEENDYVGFLNLYISRIKELGLERYKNEISCIQASSFRKLGEVFFKEEIDQYNQFLNDTLQSNFVIRY